MHLQKTMIVTLVLVAMALACSEEDSTPTSSDIDRVDGSGVIANEERSVESFHSLTMNAVGHVNITQGTPPSLALSVDDNILPLITTQVSSGTLVISEAPGYDLNNYDLTVNVTMSNVRNLNVSGAGSITAVNQLEADELNLMVDGVGTVYLGLDVDHVTTAVAGVATIMMEGSATRHNCSFTGIGNLNAFGLSTDTTHVIITGEGEAYVTVSQFLRVLIAGVGTVRYYGQPTIDQTITGSGQVTPGP